MAGEGPTRSGPCSTSSSARRAWSCACSGRRSSPTWSSSSTAGSTTPGRCPSSSPGPTPSRGGGPGRPRSGCGGTGPTGRRTTGRSPAASSWTGSSSACRTRGRALPRRALRRDGVVARPGPPGTGPRARDARGDPAPGLRRPRRGGGAERRLRGQRRLPGHLACGRATRRTARREGTAATARAAPSASAWGATPGSGAGARTSRSSGSRGASTCSSAHLAERARCARRGGPASGRRWPPRACSSAAATSRRQSLSWVKWTAVQPCRVAASTLPQGVVEEDDRLSEADDAEVALGPVVEVRVALHDAQVARERDPADGEQRRQALLEVPRPPGLLVGHQRQRHAEVATRPWRRPGPPASTTKSSSNQHCRAASTPMSQPSSCSASARADSTGRVPVTTSAQAVGEERLVQAARIDAEALAEGDLPRPAPAPLGIEEHAVDVEGQQRAGVLLRSVRRLQRVTASTVPCRRLDGPCGRTRRTSRGASTPAAAARRSAGRDRRAPGARRRRRRPGRTSRRLPSIA